MSAPVRPSRFANATVADCFPAAPVEWQAWPAAVEVSFTLLEGTCVYRALYEEYAAADMLDAATKFFLPANDQIFVNYRLHARGLVPAFAWYVTWSIMRKGVGVGFQPRGPIQGAAPWDWGPDDTLLHIVNEPRGGVYTPGVRTLRVGGRTKREAAENWWRCVGFFREIRRRVRAPEKPRSEGSTGTGEDQLVCSSPRR